ncbi:MAG: ABC transporter ATP-binding protein [Pirellula sp.]
MSQAISVKGLEMHFPGCEALRGIDLSVKPGTVFALLGENGAGKTTLIRILTGFQLASAGTCSVLGLDPRRDDLEIRRRIGYVSDAPALYDWMQVGEIGWFAAAFYADGYMDRYRESIDRFEVPQNRKIKHLSKGQRAKVALALALAHDPELLILDEPTSGLDPLVRREFLESMVERAATGRTVLLSSHQIAEVERVADEIAILHQGRIRIVDSLHHLRESVHKITISLTDPLIVLPHLDGPVEVLSEVSEGRQVCMVVRGDVDPIMSRLESCSGVKSVAVRPATLDELFVACTRGKPTSVNRLVQTNPMEKSERQAS